mgnify:CR=1 FL=1
MVRTLEEVVSNNEVNNMSNEVQTPLQLFREKTKAVKKLTDTLYLHHNEAYNVAAKEHLMDKGQVDYSRLEDDATQEKFALHMADFYVTKARQSLGIGKDVKLDENQTNMLMMAYAGITKTELLELVRTNGEEFTLEAFKGVADRFKKSVHDKLAPTAAEHITRKHIPGVIKEMKLEDMVDASKMDVGDVIQLMGSYHLNEGVIPSKAYKKAIYYKQPHAKAA